MSEDDQKRLEEEQKKKELEEKWKKVKEKMEQRSNPLDLAHRSEVANVYENYFNALPSRSQRLYLLTLPVSLTGMPYVVRRDQIPELMRTDPVFYEKYREMMLKEEKK